MMTVSEEQSIQNTLLDEQQQQQKTVVKYPKLQNLFY